MSHSEFDAAVWPGHSVLLPFVEAHDIISLLLTVSFLTESLLHCLPATINQYRVSHPTIYWLPVFWKENLSLHIRFLEISKTNYLFLMSILSILPNIVLGGVKLFRIFVSHCTYICTATVITATPSCSRIFIQQNAKTCNPSDFLRFLVAQNPFRISIFLFQDCYCYYIKWNGNELLINYL